MRRGHSRSRIVGPGARRRSASHAVGGGDADQVEGACDDRPRRLAEGEAERLRLGAQHFVVVVEAVEVVRNADRIVRNRVCCPPLGRLGGNPWKLDQPLDEVALLRRERACKNRPVLIRHTLAGVAQDAGDPGVRVLHVVDGVLLRLMRGEVVVGLGAAGTDVYEFKLLLGEDITPKLHWGRNLVYEREIDGEKAQEFAITQGISYTLIDQVLSAGIEMFFKYENVEGERDHGEHKFNIGPSVQWRPTKSTHLDLVCTFGCTDDAVDTETFIVFGWDFDKGGEVNRYKPVSGLRE